MSNLLIAQHLWCISLMVCRYGFFPFEHPVSQFVKNTVQYDLPPTLAFINRRDTFTCVSKEYSFKMFEGYNVPMIYENLMKCILSSEKLETVWPGDDQFQGTDNNVQHDKLSAALFSRFIDDLSLTIPWKSKRRGIIIEQRGMAYLWFSDALIIFSSRPENMEDVLYDQNIFPDVAEDREYFGKPIRDEVYLPHADDVEIILRKNPVFFLEEITRKRKHPFSNGGFIQRKLETYGGNPQIIEVLPDLDHHEESEKKWQKMWDYSDLTCHKYDCETWAKTADPVKRLTGCSDVLNEKCGTFDYYDMVESLTDMSTSCMAPTEVSKRSKEKAKWVDLAYTETEWYAAINNEFAYRNGYEYYFP